MRPVLLRATVVLAALLAAAGHAEPVGNGNELALNYTRADAIGRQGIQQEFSGRFHTFRYLRVTQITTNAAGSGPVLLTVEPSSDMEVVLVVGGKLSLDMVSTIATGECVAAKGRVKSIGVPPNRIVVEPALLQHKDRITPKAGAELLPEVDPRAVK